MSVPQGRKLTLHQSSCVKLPIHLSSKLLHTDHLHLLRKNPSALDLITVQKVLQQLNKSLRRDRPVKLGETLGNFLQAVPRFHELSPVIYLFIRHNPQLRLKLVQQIFQQGPVFPEGSGEEFLADGAEKLKELFPARLYP